MEGWWLVKAAGPSRGWQFLAGVNMDFVNSKALSFIEEANHDRNVGLFLQSMDCAETVIDAIRDVAW